MDPLVIGQDEMRFLVKALKRVDYFEDLSIQDLDEIFRYISLYRFDKGQYIFKQGDPPDGLYIVHKGKLEVSVKKGTFSFAKKVALLNPSDFFGEMALMEDNPRSASVKSLSECELFVLLKSSFDSILESNPSFSQKMKSVSDKRKYETKRRAA